ncbi:MAG: flagellar biosynthesis protein FlhB [bacterium]|nr:flagellar biosynthesis protein FlhB [bacterium]
MSQENRSQRTEKPTPKRLKQARERGQLPRSKEVSSAAVLIGFLLFARFLGPMWLDRMQVFMNSWLASTGHAELTVSGMAAWLASLVAPLGVLLVLPLGTLFVSSLGGSLIQGAPTFTMKPFQPKADKLNPLKGLKRMVSLKQWVEVVKSLLKMSLYGVVAYAAARNVLVYQPPGTSGAGETFRVLVSLTHKMLIYGSVLAVGLGLLDYMFRRYDHERDLKMTKREIKDEQKETEGDPAIRARIRQKQMALARTRMMADVAKATVVVTNPTHFAIALRYVPGETASPRLLAKGRAILADRIRALAKEHGVPIVSDPPLARALYKSVPIGAEIPPALFRAVAEVLALVMARRPSASSPSAGHTVRP